MKDSLPLGKDSKQYLRNKTLNRTGEIALSPVNAEEILDRVRILMPMYEFELVAKAEGEAKISLI
ncbi:MAG: hypothetical protein AB9882_02525 [Ignavibacteriaceae bacterium]